MSRQFEGVAGFWRQPDGYDTRTQLLLYADHDAQRLYVRAARQHRWISDEVDFRLHPMLGLLHSADSVVTREYLFVQMRHDADFVRFLESLDPELGPIEGLTDRRLPPRPGFLFDVPGISLLRKLGGYSDFNFSRVAGTPIELAGTDLSGLEFNNVDFSDATLAGTRFSGARFENCRFGQRQLERGLLDGVRFQRQSLRHHNLEAAALTGAAFVDVELFSCRMAGADCRGLTVESARFIGCDCKDASFEGMSGSSILFERCHLIGTRFDDAKVKGWAFPESTLRETSFKQAALINASFAASEGRPAPFAIENIDLDGADLSGTDFSGVDLAAQVRFVRPPRFGASETQRTRLVGAQVALSFLGMDCSFVDARDASFVNDLDPARDMAGFRARHAVLPGIVFAGLQLDEADFTGADLSGARFGNARLSDAIFSAAVLEGADFTGAVLDEAAFADATLASANFTSAWLLQATFDDTILDRTNFSSAMLASANFAKLHGLTAAGVNFSNACLVEAEFNGVTFMPAGSQQTSFANACLAGADFSGAHLTDVVLTNAQIAAEPGELTVNFHGQPPLPIVYRATLMDPARTGPQTVCPDGGNGPCSLQRLLFRPVRPVWPG